MAESPEVTKKVCPDCGPSQQSHFQKYIESFAAHLLPPIFPKLALALERSFEKFLFFIKLLKKEEFIASKAPHLWTAFIDEAKRRDMKIKVFCSPFGYTNRFELEFASRRSSFCGLPRAEFLNTVESEVLDDKLVVKKVLIKNKIPTPQGGGFNWFQEGKAIEFGIRLGFPLVVKPRSGSMCHHVTLNIQTTKELQRAIKIALSYEPFFIVERYMAGAKTFRATVIDNKFIACADRIPANIVGDNIHTIEELVNIKNRTKQPSEDYCPITLDVTTKRLLEEQGLTSQSVPRFGRRVFLQQKVTLSFGADIVEVTPLVHQDNIKLFEKISEIFNTKLVGIDFLTQDIRRSWRDQVAGVIELNSLPHINMHHFPTEGRPVNVAAHICDMVEKYY